MLVKLKLIPFSATASKTNSINFVLSGLSSSSEYRITFENATSNKPVFVKAVDSGSFSSDKIFAKDVSIVNGKIDLNVSEVDSYDVISVYANVEEKINNSWKLKDIAAFSFQIEKTINKRTTDKVSVYPPFVGMEDKVSVKVKTDPNSSLQVLVNGKRFLVKSNYSGEGSISFRSLDILSGTGSSSGGLKKFPVYYSKKEDNFNESYDSGSFIHFVPENMKALQASNDPNIPECAILDSSPSQGLTLNKLDNYCIDGAVVGEYSIFNNESSFYDSKVGFCSSLKEVYPNSEINPSCRIYNSTSCSLLHNGSGLLVFSAQQSDASDEKKNLTSRVFVANLPSSLKYNGNPVRNGSIVAPPKFYHSVTPSNISKNEKYGITFRVDDGTVFEIQYTTLIGDAVDLVTSFVHLINYNRDAIKYGIKATSQSSFIEIVSDNKFTINASVISGSGTFKEETKSNTTIDLLVSEDAINDTGNTVVFLTPQIGYASHSIVARDYVNNVIKINVPEGFNNDIGPNILSNIFCQNYAVVDSTKELEKKELNITVLPPVKDKYNRELSCVYPVITTRRINATGEEIAYIVCQVPINGVYQLFYFSFRVGSQIENTTWKQLTYSGENKNPKIKCDSVNNLHIIWESDRIGPTQLYYSVLGPSSKAINNKVLMSVIDKNEFYKEDVELLKITEPVNGLQNDWTRILSNNGKVSVYDRNYIDIKADASSDAAMALFSFYKDEFGNEFPSNFKQISYQISFDLWMPLLPTGVLEKEQIEDVFSLWKSTFKPVGDYKYENDGNIYTIDSYNEFFENFIPICGSYKIDQSLINTLSGGMPTEETVHNGSSTYGSFEKEISLTNDSNVRHFMLALVPEKIRFTAKNTETFSQYCERRSNEGKDCDNFNNEINYKIGTGKYKLALLISTSNNESTGDVSKKKYHIYRLLDKYVDFRKDKNIKIAVHYNKMDSDYIESLLKRDKETFSNENRYHGDIIVTLDNEVAIAASFVSDFSDQYRKFDIGLGIPYGSGFQINESSPYKGNLYEPGITRQVFSNIKISPHTVLINPKSISISDFDRNVSQIFISNVPSNILPNGGFEDTVLPYSSSVDLLDGFQSVTGWTVNKGAIYRRTDSFIPAEYTGLRSSVGKSWIELTGSVSGNFYNHGSISTTLDTEIGKTYYVFFDLSNHPDSYLQGSSVTKKVKVIVGSYAKAFFTTARSTSPIIMNWRTSYVSFKATQSKTVITFENISNQFNNTNDIKYGPQLDNVIVVEESKLDNELMSLTCAENLMIDQREFDLNYNLNASDNFSQIPITISKSYQNKNADIFIDKIDKVHICWQSNRKKYWDIYYSGSLNRGEPFYFDTDITNSKSDSINPSISVDSKGRRFVAWQDNRSGNYQIYSALSKNIDDLLLDRCKQDQVEEFIYKNKISLIEDPYSDPVSQFNCALEFVFVAPEDQNFHFNAIFYEDDKYKNVYKVISSKNNINGWKINNKQLSYNGLSASYGSSYNVSYTPSYDDDITGKVLYVVIEHEINSKAIDLESSVNVKVIQPYSGLNLRYNRLEDSSNFKAILEFEGESPIKIDSQALSYFNNEVRKTMIFKDSLSELPGVKEGERVRSVLVHFDPVGSGESLATRIKFNSPILAVFTSAKDLVSTNKNFGYPGVLYQETSGIGLENTDAVRISSDRKTLEISCYAKFSADELRVIVANDSAALGQNQFVYYCPSEQSLRCDINCNFYNNFNDDKSVDFRVTFYANPEKTEVIMSSFSKEDTFGWFSGQGSQNGFMVKSGQSISVYYSPEILPFEIYESQTESLYKSSKIKRQPLLCGVPYTVVVESYRDGNFYIESESLFLCPCKKTYFDSWRKDTDSSSWISSGQGFEDTRISISDKECLFPKVNVTENNIFYISWQDFRYTKLVEGQNSISPDYFLAIYNSETEEFICSGQGSYDRRLTYFSENNKTLYDAYMFVDPFQNINLVLHDGYKIYSQICSLGCKFNTLLNNKVIKPCAFTDETDSSFFVLGKSPERSVDQYQKIRIKDKNISFSTYIDLQTPIPVIDDCFVELDIIGVPGTYAYRLKNENDEEWSEWLPIGPDLPSQEGEDSSVVNKERDFFRAYFIEKDRFIAPWITSSGDGVKRVCCEVLTFFGKTESFCFDFMSIYNKIEYKIDLFFDEKFEKPVAKFKNYMVVSNKQTDVVISDEDLSSIKEDFSSVSKIYVKVEFKDKEKINNIEKMQKIERFNLDSNIKMDVYQQGINDQLGINLVKVSEGIYSGSFDVFSDDGIINIDGMGLISINVPGQCNSVSRQSESSFIVNVENDRVSSQTVSLFNNFTVFRDQYIKDDIKGSFANPDYYKIRKFGKSLSDTDENGTWLGGDS